MTIIDSPIRLGYKMSGYPLQDLVRVYLSEDRLVFFIAHQPDSKILELVCYAPLFSAFPSILEIEAARVVVDELLCKTKKVTP